MTDQAPQTSLGRPPDVTGDITVSLSEIDAMGRKAARGAGYSWGMAEEAGRAARWLAAYRLPGPERLLKLLEVCDGDVNSHIPSGLDEPDAGKSGPVCGLTLGAALSDRADIIRDGGSYKLEQVIEPLLILPFLCRAARDLEFSLLLEYGGASLAITAAGPLDADLDSLGFLAAGTVSVHSTTDLSGKARVPSPLAWPVPVKVWQRLDHYATRTYVPATEESRRRGAG